MKRLFLLCALLPTPAFADACMDISKAKELVAEKHGTWVERAQAQWEFMRGAFFANPRTADRLPYGDKAAMGLSEEQADAVVFFLDGDRACDMLYIPHTDMATLADVGAGVALHEEKKPGENP